MSLSKFNHGRRYPSIFHLHHSRSIDALTRAFEACQSRRWGECHLVGYSRHHYHCCPNQTPTRIRWRARRRRRASLSPEVEESLVATASAVRRLRPFESLGDLSRWLWRQSVVTREAGALEPETLLYWMADLAQGAICHIYEQRVGMQEEGSRHSLKFRLRPLRISFCFVDPIGTNFVRTRAIVRNLVFI